MHIKRFEAPTMQEALAQVRRELGPDALILSSRTIKRGRQAFGLLSRSVVEVQAAKERGSQASVQTAQHDDVRLSLSSLADPDSPTPMPGSGREDPDRLALRRQLARLERQEEFEEEMRSELRGLRVALGSVMRGATGPDSEAAFGKLSAMGLDAAHCALLSAEFQERAAAQKPVDLVELLHRNIDAKLAPPREDDNAFVRILVGAPGVGKTTTLAKLAARSEEGERDVALISLDHYRIGAAEQLRRYADLLESPFSEISSAEGIGRVIRQFPGRSVLIDTAGRGRGAEERMTSLLPLRDQLGDRARIELVVDATARPEVHAAQLQRFARLRPDRLIFAKADECDSLVPLANLVLAADCPPVSWMGTGQRVPEDLELAEADQIVADLIGRAA